MSASQNYKYSVISKLLIQSLFISPFHYLVADVVIVFVVSSDVFGETTASTGCRWSRRQHSSVLVLESSKVSYMISPVLGWMAWWNEGFSEVNILQSK